MWYPVIRFEDHEPNFFASLAHAVPSPHQAGSRIRSVAFTSWPIASRRLSRLTNRYRVAAGVTRGPPSVLDSLGRVARPVPVCGLIQQGLDLDFVWYWKSACRPRPPMSSCFEELRAMIMLGVDLH